MKNVKKKSVISKIIFLTTIVSFFLKLANLLFRKREIKTINKNLKDFEKKEINELLKYAKGSESSEKYWHDSLGIFQEYFIPNHKNNHEPKILRTRSLITIAFILTILKISVLSYIFFINPFEAWMSEMITGKVVELINKEREVENLPVLTLNPSLSFSALAKANDMIEKGYFAHFTPDGRKPWDFINRDDYPYLYVGENLAMNFTSADSVHKALMDSPTHKRNIMSSKYNEIGIALVSGEIDGKKTNILVQLFGSRNQLYLTATEKLEKKPKTVTPTKLAQTNQTETKINEKNGKKLSQPEQVPNTVTQVAGLDQQFSSQNQINQIPKLIEEFTNNKNTAEIAGSPNNSLSNNEIKKIIKMPNSDIPRITFVSSVIESFNGIFVISLILVIMALIFNILVRIKIQHKPIIVQTFLLLIFIAGLAYWQLDLAGADITEIFIL